MCLTRKIKVELTLCFKLLNDHQINLDVLGEYEPRTIFRFITEELFECETDDVQLPGMTKNIIYEEFHPNHKMDIENETATFMNDFFENRFNEYSTELNDRFVLSDGCSLNRETVIKKLNAFIGCFDSFSNHKYVIEETKFQWNEDKSTGLGHAEGIVQFNAVLADGDSIHFEDRFKFYMSNEGYGWSIYYFVFPGFTWG